MVVVLIFYLPLAMEGVVYLVDLLLCGHMMLLFYIYTRYTGVGFTGSQFVSREEGIDCRIDG